MFEQIPHSERHLLFQTLLHAVKSNSGIGFANADQGHPAYRIGKSGNHDYETFGDSPNRNLLFKMMYELSISANELDESFTDGGDLIFSWADFCTLATEAYDKHKSSLNGPSSGSLNI